jgi:dienelactone hydrolase
MPAMRIKIYPDARHGFDVNRPARRYLGHVLEYDKAADDDAHAQAAQFLAERLAMRN